MLSTARRTTSALSRVASRGFKVAVIGASGGIGQPLSMLLKQNEKVTELSLYDVSPMVVGVAADLSHVSTPARVTGFTGDTADAAMEGCDVVIVPAGVPRRPGMTRDDLFNVNGGINKSLAEAMSRVAPGACPLVISNPVNSMVPIWAETLKAAGVYDPKKLFGVTTLDVVRANTFVAEKLGIAPSEVNVTVLGGHAGTTILPILGPYASGLDEETVKALTHRIQFGGDEVVKAKDGGGSATLSMAYAGAIFAGRLLDAMAGEPDVVECAFVESALTSCPFFASQVKLGPSGVEGYLPLPGLTAFEQEGLDAMLPDLTGQVAKGAKFASS